MPTKKLRVSFDIDVEVLTAALARSHHAMRIETYEEREEAQIIPPKQLRLRKFNGKIGMQRAVLDRLKTQHSISTKEVKTIFVSLGYSDKSVHNQMYLMMGRKLIRRRGKGVYAITKKGAEA